MPYKFTFQLPIILGGCIVYTTFGGISAYHWSMEHILRISAPNNTLQNSDKQFAANPLNKGQI
jgi:hypothetical protein